MPNWCSNLLRVVGPERYVNLLVERIRGDIRLFRSTYPCPPPLLAAPKGSREDIYHVYYGPRTHLLSIARRYHPHLLSSLGTCPHSTADLRDRLKGLLDIDKPEDLRVANKYRRNFEEYGHLTWYSWCIANWGTKWDVNLDPGALASISPCETSTPGVVEFELQFETAWDPPKKWVDRVGEECPDLDFCLEYWELGSWFAGQHKVTGGYPSMSEEGEPTSLLAKGAPLSPRAWEWCVEYVKENLQSEDDYERVFAKRIAGEMEDSMNAKETG